MKSPTRRHPPGRFEVSSQVMHRNVDGEMVLLHLETGVYFGLNESGRRVWELLLDGRSTQEIPALLAEEYDVSRRQAREDVRNLLADLQKYQLIHLLEAVPTSNTGPHWDRF